MSFRPALLLALPFLLVGCADGLMSTSASETGAPAATSKVRHARLLDVAPRTPSVDLPVVDSARKGDDDRHTDKHEGHGHDEYVGLIISLDPYRVVERYGEMDPFRVVERYRVFNRYRVFERYEYEHVFAGAAMWVAEGDLDDLIADMEEDAMINWIEPDVEMSLSPLGLTAESGGQSETLPWGVAQIGAGFGAAPGVDLYVADTGITSDDVDERGGVDLSKDAGGRHDSEDRDGHGTHIAGIAGALANGSGTRGVAPGLGVYDLRVLTGKEKRDETPVDLSSAIAAVEYATGAKLANPQRPAVLNFSLGTDVGTAAYNALDDAVEAATASGVVVVVAAGNSGQDVSTISPAHARGAITVGAYDQDVAFASFSNRGAGIDILAPGVDILSTKKGRSGVSVMSGTSMAAAHVSGAAALFLQENPQATPAQVAAALVSAARPTATGVPAGTTNRTLWVGDGGALDLEMPPFFDYAVYSDGKVEVRGRAQIAAADGNANVFAGELKAGEKNSRIEGFGYYTDKVEKKAEKVFEPRVNPTGLDAVQRTAPLDFDKSKVSVSVLRPRATRTTHGDLKLSGTVQLGTADAPVVWLVTGKLKIDRDVQISGHGVFLVREKVEVKKDISAEAGSALAILTDGDIKIDADFVRLPATLFARGTIEVRNDAHIDGSLTGLEEVKVDGDVTIRKVPMATSLTRALWDN